MTEKKDKEIKVNLKLKSNNNPSDSFKFDVKVLRYALLTYVMYGVFSIFNLGAFVVPLPMVFIIVPLVAAIYIVRNKFAYQSIVLLVLPIVVLDELWMGSSPVFMRMFLLLAIAIWVFWGSSFLWKEELKNTQKSLIMGVSQFFLILTIIDNIGAVSYLGMVVPFIGAFLYYQVNKNNKSIYKDLRVVLLLILIALLYFITLGSLALVLL